jgi:N-acetylglucosamine kinase-like BadF-type ATPase
MNQQVMQAFNQLKSIRNPQQMAMQSLQNAARQGNPMAKNILDNIESGNMQNVEQVLGNYMKEQGLNIDEIRKMIR